MQARICTKCHKNICRKNSKGGYRNICRPCDRRLYCSKSRANYKMRKRAPYSKYKKDKCETCGFVSVNKCQLDVDHIDGNHDNNELSNLQTLCANCHRLKTYLNADWEDKRTYERNIWI